MPLERFANLPVLRNRRGLKLLSLLLAVMVWYGIRRITSNEALIKDVPVVVRLDEGWAVLEQSAAKVDVLFSGSQQDLRYLNREQIRVEIDLRAKGQAGVTLQRITPRDVSAPGGARAVSVAPDAVRLSLDREVEMEVPVRAEIAGTPPAGRRMSGAVCTPDRIRLRGPRSRVSEVQEIHTEPIELEGRSRSFVLTRRLRPPDDTWTPHLDPEQVRVEVQMVDDEPTTAGPAASY